jgi:hypothetical protein
LEKILERESKGDKEKIIKDKDRKRDGESIFNYAKGEDFLIVDEDVLMLKDTKMVEYIQYLSPLRAIELIYPVSYCLIIWIFT